VRAYADPPFYGPRVYAQLPVNEKWKSAVLYTGSIARCCVLKNRFWRILDKSEAEKSDLQAT